MFMMKIFEFSMGILNARLSLAETWSVFYDEITVRTHMVILQRSTQLTKARKFLLLLFSFHTKESFAQEPSREERAWNQKTIDFSRGSKDQKKPLTWSWNFYTRRMLKCRVIKSIFIERASWPPSVIDLIRA
jgi:hypothetical protein